MNSVSMSSEEFCAWQTTMGYRSQQAAANALGVSLATYKRYRRSGVPKVVALACAALARGLTGWAHSA